MSDNGFLLGEESYKTSRKSLRALKSHISSTTADKHTRIHLIINLANPIVKTNDYVPRIITLPHKIDKLSGKSVLVITKDPSTPYRDALMKKGSPTEDYITEIVTLRKLKRIASNYKTLEKVYNEYDLIACDHRIQKFLPQILGAKFMKKNKKVPFMVQMSRPTEADRLVAGKRSQKLKDENCDPEYVAKQLKIIARNTKFVPHENGTVLDVVIGDDGMDNTQLLGNIDAVLRHIIDNKNLKSIVGLKTTEKLIKGGVKMYRDVHVKTSESISLPVFKSAQVVDRASE